jgi:glutaredoxin 3
MSSTGEVVVYTMNYCPYCLQAKKLLTQRGISFREVLVGEDDDAMWDELFKKSGLRTMPQIFSGDQLIGGYRELSQLDQENKLESLRK